MSGLQSIMEAGCPPASIAHIRSPDAALIATLIFFTVLCYAAVRDIRTKEVGDYVHVIIVVTAFIGFERATLPAMFIGAIVTALPLLIAGLAKKGSVGGADIKLMAASGLILGASRGLIALTIGLMLGVVCTYTFRKLRKTDLKRSFPLVPFLAAGCAAAYLL
jgi:leader peptidase (prepilin peptidase)/N-methyltransferase